MECNEGLMHTCRAHLEKKFFTHSANRCPDGETLLHNSVKTPNGPRSSNKVQQITCLNAGQQIAWQR